MIYSAGTRIKSSPLSGQVKTSGGMLLVLSGLIAIKEWGQVIIPEPAREPTCIFAFSSPGA